MKTNRFLFSVCVFCFLCVLCAFAFSGEFTPLEALPLTGFIYDSHGKKDPFSPPVLGAVEKTGEDVLKDVKLEGIIWDEKKPIAIINNKVVGAGDDIGGAKIKEIKKDEVIFDINGQIVNIRLRKEV